MKKIQINSRILSLMLIMCLQSMTLLSNEPKSSSQQKDSNQIDEAITTASEQTADILEQLKRKDEARNNEKFEAELNKVMNSSSNLRNRSIDEISMRSTIWQGSTLFTDRDHIEYQLRKSNKDLTDDDIDNKMIGERAFLLSIVGYAALSNPVSAPAVIAGSMIYSIYRLQDRIDFRENYKKDPVQAKAAIDNWSIFIKHWLVSGLVHATPSILHNTPAIYDYISTGKVTAEPLFPEALEVIPFIEPRAPNSPTTLWGKLINYIEQIRGNATIPTATEIHSATGTPIAPWYQQINYSDTAREAFIVKDTHQTPGYLVDIDHSAWVRYHENVAPEAIGAWEGTASTDL